MIGTFQSCHVAFDFRENWNIAVCVFHIMDSDLTKESKCIQYSSFVFKFALKNQHASLNKYFVSTNSIKNQRINPTTTIIAASQNLHPKLQNCPLEMYYRNWSGCCSSLYLSLLPSAPRWQLALV